MPETNVATSGDPVKAQQSDGSDIIARVSKVAAKPQGAPVVLKSDDNGAFDFSELDALKTPEEMKSWVTKAYRSLEGGYTKKFQKLAEERRLVEEEKKKSSEFTPERIAEFAKNDKFVAAVQDYLSSGADKTNQLSPEHKAELDKLREKVDSIEAEKVKLATEKRHSELKEKYTSYDKEKIEGVLQSIAEGTMQFGLEEVYKATDYEDAIRRAYNLGLEDRKKDTGPVGVGASGVDTSGGEGLTIREGEDSQTFLQRVLTTRLLQSKNKGK